MKKVIYDLLASEERMLNDWRNNNKIPIKIKQAKIRNTKTKKPKKIKKITEINHAKGLSYNEFLQSKYWLSIRKIIFKRDNFQCVSCHSTNNLHVHHLSYKHHGFEHLYLKNLTTVCDKCHRIIHGII